MCFISDTIDDYINCAELVLLILDSLILDDKLPDRSLYIGIIVVRG